MDKQNNEDLNSIIDDKEVDINTDNNVNHNDSQIDTSDVEGPLKGLNKDLDSEMIKHISDDTDNVISETNSKSNEAFDQPIDGDNMMLSTIDNPFNPKVDYELWKQWDRDSGHHTEEYIARLISMEDTYDVDDEFKLNMLTNKVINDILENDDQDLYRLL